MDQTDSDSDQTDSDLDQTDSALSEKVPIEYSVIYCEFYSNFPVGLFFGPRCKIHGIKGIVKRDFWWDFFGPAWIGLDRKTNHYWFLIVYTHFKFMKYFIPKPFGDPWNLQKSLYILAVFLDDVLIPFRRTANKLLFILSDESTINQYYRRQFYNL